MIRSILLFLVCCSSAHGAPPCPAIRKSGGARAPPCPMVSAPLPDSIHPMVLQRCADELSLPLSIIFQQSFDTGQVREDWKLAVVSPIFKKGKKSDPGNYRPVSLTSVPCKIMEAMIKTELTKYLETTGIVSDCQHGFTKGRSCLTNLLETFEAWTRILEGGHGIDVVFLDFRKAFDSVSHKKLIMKLQAYGIDEKMINWIENYLTGKSMAVRVNGKLSSWATVLSGVPQGSVLGPLLFLLFVNELPAWIINSMMMFADDAKIWTKISSKSDSESLQEDLNKLIIWSQTWLLKFHPEKCKVMHIGHQINTTYNMTDSGKSVQLNPTREEKDLGVYIVDSLKPSLQCIKA